MTIAFDLPAWARPQFPALGQPMEGVAPVFFDGPAGTQVPRCVADAVCEQLLYSNANQGGVFATSERTDERFDAARDAACDLLGANDPDSIVFGPNMTTLTFAVARALAHTWRPGDEVIVTELDHDANIAPWLMAAERARARVRTIPVRPEDCTLDWEALEKILSSRTRLVAVGYASNAVGTVNPIRKIIERAHAVGALCFVDAVHALPHRRIDVNELGCDLLVCSAYKFFGPHLGILWARRQLLEELPVEKVRPAPDRPPGRWMTGTPPFELIHGMRAAVDYLAELGRASTGGQPLERRAALDAAYRAIQKHEEALANALLEKLSNFRMVRVLGIHCRHRIAERVSTISVTHPHQTPVELARQLAEHGIYVWHGNFYALQLSKTLGLEPHGMLRIGLVHYNSIQEIDRLAVALEKILGA